MYDEFIPAPPLKCSQCGMLLDDKWQSKEFGCELSVWKQGEKLALSKDNELLKTPATPLKSGTYEIYNNCENCDKWNTATIKVVNGVWFKTVQNMSE